MAAKLLLRMVFQLHYSSMLPQHQNHHARQRSLEHFNCRSGGSIATLASRMSEVESTELYFADSHLKR